ncbi:MAG: IPT/TIG domain-containing protein [Undibacterium sp.]|nr:IPT/TIG domain-containing protein [Undibacterium sp.]
MMLLHLRVFCLFLLTMFGLLACGGGGSVVTPPSLVLSISAVTPLSAYPGDTLQVQGVGLDRVQKALLGGVAASFTSQSSTQLSLVVPVGAIAGLVELQAAGAVAQSIERVTILSAPMVIALAPAIAKPGDSVIISGSNLDQVREVRLNDLLLGLTQKTATQLSFTIPSEARSGTVSLSYGNNAVLRVPTSLTVQTPVILRSFSPAEGLVGSTVTIDGEGMDLVAQVVFGTQGATPLQRSVNRLTVAVPVGAGSGPLVLVKSDAGRIVGSDNFSVIPAILFTDLQPSTARAGLTVTINGQNFSEVAGVTVNGQPVNLLTRSETALTFAMPAGGGAVLLKGRRQADVGAGVLTEQPPKATVSVSRVEVVQTYLQAPGEIYQRLVPGKSALLRVLVAGSEGSASPVVQLTASSDNVALGSAQLTGPATLSATPQVGVLAHSFNTKLPASWLRQNLVLLIEVDPQKLSSDGATYTARPVVGKTTNFNLVLVPLSISEGNVEAVVPDLTTVRTLLGKVLPIPEASIKVSQRATYRLTSVTQVKTDDEWSKALSELDALRDAEGQEKHYYGLVPDANFQSGNTGLGYVPNFATNGDNRSSIGLDARQSFHLRTMTHELGHNFGRDHAPCGGAGSPDAAFPYANGGLGSTLIYDNVAELIAVVSKPSDVMGYCNGSWFSDYNYYHVQNWLESWLYPMSQPMKMFSTSVELMEIAGEIDAQGVRFQPVFGSFGQPSHAQGEYQLRLQLSDGSQVLEAFSAVKVADSQGARWHFKLKLHRPALEITRMEVLKAGQVLPISQAKLTAAAQRTGDPGPSLLWQESGDQLQLSWNDSRYRYLSVSHVGNTTTLLARQLQGGKAQLSIASLSGGGEWQLVLSDGLNTRLMRVKR